MEDHLLVDPSRSIFSKLPKGARGLWESDCAASEYRGRRMIRGQRTGPFEIIYGSGWISNNGIAASAITEVSTTPFGRFSWWESRRLD